MMRKMFQRVQNIAYPQQSNRNDKQKNKGQKVRHLAQQTNDCYYIQNFMRIFVNFNDPVPCDRVCRINTYDCNNTTDLLQLIANLCKLKRIWLIAKLKNQIVNLRIVEDWSLDAYPLKNGSWIFVDVVGEGRAEISPIMSNKELQQIEEELQLQLQDGVTRSIDPKPTFASSNSSSEWGKYFEQCLQKFLGAVRQGSLEEASLLLKEQPECDNQQIISTIMQKKTRYLLDELGQCGRTALHWAVQEKNLDIVEFLLIKSCNPNLVSLDQYTPLQLAISMHTASIFHTLINHPKIDLNAKTEKGTALHIAIRYKQLDFAKKLLECGADPDSPDVKGVSPRQLAISMKINNFSFDSSPHSKYQVPYILRGKILKVSTFSYRLKDRFLLVNPFTNQLIIYDQKTLQDKFYLNMIKKVELVKQKTWMMKKQYTYFTIEQTHEKLLFATRNPAICTEWLEQIKKCLNFIAKNNTLSENQFNTPIKLKAEEQLIEAIDDESNQIKIHKRKTPKNTSLKNNSTPVSAEMRVSLFDIKQVKQEVMISDFVGKKQEQELSKKSEKTNSEILDKNKQTKDSNQLTASNVAASEGSSESPAADFRESQLLGSVIDNKFLHKIPEGRSTINNADFKSEKIRLNSYEQKNAPPISFAHFEILRALGNGSFGKVFLARHRTQHSLYALKVLNKKKLAAKKQLKYAVGQANILKRMDHPFIITLHYSFQTPTNLYIALDYCPNKDLAELLYDYDHMPEEICRFYIAQIILAINYLHMQKIIYRDLKPENILIGQDGYIRLTDFNLSKENDFSMSFCGSPAYLSPEMLEKRGVGRQADIYGIGCVFYEMLVGEPPYFDENIEVLYDNIRCGKLKYPSWISKTAKSLLSSLLERDIKKRIGVKNIQQIKKHQFFHNFDWQKLLRRQIPIPDQIKQKITSEMGMQLEVIKDDGFNDIDYSSPTNMMNRVKNFTFIRN